MFLKACAGVPCPVTTCRNHATNIVAARTAAAGRNRRPAAIMTPPTDSASAATRPNAVCPKPMPRCSTALPTAAHRSGPPVSFSQPWK